jgi:hypothetical protein
MAVGGIDSEGGNEVKLVVYAGAVWAHCSPVEVERFDVSSYEEAVQRLAEWLDWLTPEEAERIARDALEREDAVLAGYANDECELVAVPPEEVEEYDRNRYGDAVYADANGERYWEPFYVCALIDDEV